MNPPLVFSGKARDNLASMNNNRSAGFSPIFLVIGIFVVIMLAITAMNAFSGSGSGDDDKKDANSSSKDDSKDSSTKRQDDGKYLLIPEWSVKFTLPESMRGDISYVLNLDGLDTGRTPRIQLISKKFSAGTLQCPDNQAAPKVLISMYRYSENSGGLQQFPPPFTALPDGTRYYMDSTECQSAIRRSGSTEDQKFIKNLEDAVKQTLQEM
jgi:hypothetical protein